MASEHAAVLKRIYGIDRLVEASDHDYEPARDTAQLMNAGRRRPVLPTPR